MLVAIGGLVRCVVVDDGLLEVLRYFLQELLRILAADVGWRRLEVCSTSAVGLQRDREVASHTIMGLLQEGLRVVGLTLEHVTHDARTLGQRGQRESKCWGPDIQLLATCKNYLGSR
jgi:hypothetical protein